MKKTIFALVLLCSTGSLHVAADEPDWSGKIVTAMDAAVTSEDALTTGYYIMRNAGHSTYVNGASDALYLTANLSSNYPNICDLRMTFCGSRYPQCVVYVNKNTDDNSYTIQFKNGKYLPTITKGALTASETAGSLGIKKYENMADAFYIYNKSDEENISIALDGNGSNHDATIGGSLSGWDAFDKDATDANSCNKAYQFYPVTFEAPSADNFTSGYYWLVNTSGTYSLSSKVWLTTENITAYTGGTIDGYSTTRNIATTSASDATAGPTLWRFEKYGSSDNLICINANTATPLGEGKDSPVNVLGTGISTQWSGHLTATVANISDNTDLAWLLTDNNSDNSSSNKYYIVDTDNNKLTSSSATDNDRWDIIAVPQIPLTIRSGASWATACFPFAITLPAALKAYGITGQDSQDNYVLTLSAVEGQTVAANEPVVITDSEGNEAVDNSSDRTYILDISSNGGNSVGGTILSGTTMARSGYSAGDNYLLKTDGKFHPNGESLKEVPANKAFIASSALSLTSNSTSPLRLEFATNDGTTALGAAPTATAEAPVYYDLQGRRVVYPAKGIFVTSTGQKVLIK